MKKPITINIGASCVRDSTRSGCPVDDSIADSLQFSEGGVRRLRENDEYSVQIDESDLVFLDMLGRGASSVVYKAMQTKQGSRHLRQPRFVAVKRISNLSQELRAQMKKDVKTLMDARRAQAGGEGGLEGLVAFEGAYMAAESAHVAIVMEYMDAGSLNDLKVKLGRVPEDVLSSIVAMVLRGLVFLHKQMRIVHRDIKPANILLASNGVAKIADFGISRNLDNSAAVCLTYQGTTTYMSPERMESLPYGFASDIWSLGLCLVECATGKYPYDATAGPVTLMACIVGDDPPLPPPTAASPELIDFCRLCLQKDPAARPSALQLLSHPFVSPATPSPADARRLRTCMLRAVDPWVLLKEGALVFAHQFYRLWSSVLSGGELDAVPTATGVATGEAWRHERSIPAGWPQAERLGSPAGNGSSGSGEHSSEAEGPLRPHTRPASIHAAVKSTLSGLFQSGSTFKYWLGSGVEGSGVGEAGVVRELAQLAAALRGLGAVGAAAQTVDCLTVGETEGMVMLSVQGGLRGANGRPLLQFAEVFVLCRAASGAGGRPFVAHQVFRVLQ